MQNSLSEITRTFARIGVLSFGGPAGQIALMHKVLVEEKGWLEEKRFLHALNFCMLLPGPEAMQLATYAGWLRGGVAGGLIAGTLFVMPGFLVLLGLSALYAGWGEVPLVAGLLFGLTAAVLAIVFQALHKVAKRALKGPQFVAIAVAAFVAIAFLRLPFPLVVLGAGLIGALLPSAFGVTGESGEVPPGPQPWRMLGLTVAWGVAVWGLPLALLLAWLGSGNVLADQALFFSQTAIVTFGGAYAVLVWVGQQAVEVYGWLTAEEMLTGLGLAETTPGPLILVLVFVGFLGAFRDAMGLDPYAAGALGAFVTLWFTFVPCFLWIFAGAPFLERLRGVAALSGALAAITASVVGVIANLSLWFALTVLFGEVTDTVAGLFRIWTPDLSGFDWRAAVIAAAAGIALWRGVGIGWIIAASAAAGLALTLFA